MTVTAPSGATLTVENATNIFNIPSKKDTYTVAGKDINANGDSTYAYTFNQNSVNDVLKFVKDNSNNTKYNIHDKTYVSNKNPTLNSSNPTEAAHMNSIYSYLKDTGVIVDGIIANPNGGYIVTYVGANGKKYEYPVAAPSGDNYRDAELNSQLETLIYREGSASSAGSSSGSGYGSSNAYAAANAAASNAMLNAIINGTNPNVAGATSAKQDFTISKADYKALKARYPNYSDEQLTNLIANSKWANNFGAGLDNTPTVSGLEGATLEDYLATAGEGNEASKVMTDAVIAQRSDTLLKEIANDPALYEAVVNQLRTDAAAGTVAGQRAANILNAVRQSNDVYKTGADELYNEIGGTGEDSSAGQMRSAIYNNLIGAYGGFTNQQLNKLSTDMNLQSNDVEELKTALSLIAQGLASEDAQVQRAAADEAARIANEARDRESKAEQKAQASIANANASADDIATLASLASQIAGGSGNAGGANKAATYTHKNYGTGTYNKPKYTEAPYIDENLYETLLTEDYLKFLTDKTFKRYTAQKSEAELAEQYGLSDLLSADRVVDKFTQFQEQANAESDRVFNDAQRAYVAAIAAGDAKTVEQLTRLAQTAGTGRKNLYGATALANQFAQQRANASVSNNLHYDAVQQNAMNKASIANATQSGRQQWASWVGDGDPNSSTGGFSASYNQHVGNVNAANTLYGDLIKGTMGNQSGYNNTVGTLNNDSNTTLSQYAAALNKLNTAGATTNTNNSAVVAGIKNNAAVQKLINQANK
jgi:hypothetical protein